MFVYQHKLTLHDNYGRQEKLAIYLETYLETALNAPSVEIMMKVCILCYY